MEYKKNPNKTTFEEDENKIFKNMTQDHAIAEMNRAKAFVKAAIEQRVPIYNFSDYDVDGITSAYIMDRGCRRLGAKDYHTILPTRQEGYGFTVEAANRIINEAPRNGLLILTDNGIATKEAVKVMKDANWKVVILDHHLAPEDNILPDADVIIDPNALPDSCDFHGFCAAGLAYKLFDSFSFPGTISYKKDELMRDLLAVAAVGTIADCVPLIEKKDDNTYTGDNWDLARRGIECIRENQMPVGLRALLDVCATMKNKDQKKTEFQLNTFNEDTIGYTIAPIMNAVSRMAGNASLSLELLLENDYDAAVDIATQMYALNEQRKEIQEKAVQELTEYIENNNLQDDFPIVVTTAILSEDVVVPDGLVGVIAGRIAEKYRTDAIVFGCEGEIYTGSARSGIDNGPNIKSCLDKCKDVLIKHGGHAAAAGLSAEKDKLEEFIRRADEAFGDKPSLEDLTAAYDYYVKAADVPSLCAYAEAKRPFGEGHPAPVIITQFELNQQEDGTYYKVMGANKNMIRVETTNTNHHGKVVGVNFEDNGLIDYRALGEPKSVLLKGQVSINRFTYFNKRTHQKETISTPQIQFSHINHETVQFKDAPSEIKERKEPEQDISH